MIEDYRAMCETGFHIDKPETLEKFEKMHYFQMQETIRFLELSRRYGTCEPRIETHDKKYEPRDKSEVSKIKQMKKNRVVYGYEKEILARDGFLTAQTSNRVRYKGHIKIEREEWSPKDEFKFFEKRHQKPEDNEYIIWETAIIVELYREIGEEQRLHDIYRQLVKLDRLKLGYDELGVTMPNLERDKDND